MAYQSNQEAKKRKLFTGGIVRVQGFSSPAVIKEWTSNGDPIVFFPDNSELYPFGADAVSLIEVKSKNNPNQDTKDCGIEIGQRVQTIKNGYIYSVIDWSWHGYPILQQIESDSNRFEWVDVDELIQVDFEAEKKNVQTKQRCNR